jgi:hypothetical protein
MITEKMTNTPAIAFPTGKEPPARGWPGGPAGGRDVASNDGSSVDWYEGRDGGS